MSGQSGSPGPGEVADYVAEMAGELAAMAQAAGFAQTASALMRAQISALSDLRALHVARPDDAA